MIFCCQMSIIGQFKYFYPSPLRSADSNLSDVFWNICINLRCMEDLNVVRKDHLTRVINIFQR